MAGPGALRRTALPGHSLIVLVLLFRYGLDRGSVGGLGLSFDAPARIQREPASVIPRFHLLMGLGIDPSTAYEGPQDAPADLGLHRSQGVRIECLLRDEPHTLLRVGLEHAVDDDDMEVGMLVQRGTEPVDEGHCSGACLGNGAQAATQVLLDCIQQNAQGTVERFEVVLEVIA